MCQGTDKGKLQKQRAITFVAKEKLVANRWNTEVTGEAFFTVEQ